MDGWMGITDDMMIIIMIMVKPVRINFLKCAERWDVDANGFFHSKQTG